MNGSPPLEIPYLKRPRILKGRTVVFNIGSIKAHITINVDDIGNAYEVFIRCGKSGSDMGAVSNALGRSISLGLRYGVPIEIYINQLEKIRGTNPVIDNGITIESLPDAIAKALKLFKLGWDFKALQDLEEKK